MADDDILDKYDTRGPIAPTLGNPMRVRRVNGVEVEEPILRKRASLNDGAMLVEGLQDLEFDIFAGGGGGSTGFADYAAKMRGEPVSFGGGGRVSGFADYAARRQAGTGAGSDMNRVQQHNDDYEIGSGGGGGESVSQTSYLDGDYDADLFGQPRRTPPVQYLDPAGDGDDSHERDPGYLADPDLVNDLLDQGQSAPRRVREDATFARRKW